MGKTASALIAQAKSWIGRKESDGTHRHIVDVYNGHRPLARGYKVTYNDMWCATFVSACAIATGMTDIIPTECGCQEMIQKFKAIDEWNGDPDRIPNPGDVIFYDWQGDGHADHVGIVESCNWSIITVIEGNYKDAVGRRQIPVGYHCIKGYGIPAYSKTSVDIPRRIWDFLMYWLGNPHGVAGLMGNLYAESALNPKNLQQTFEKKLGMTDESYTEGVDSGSYTNFVHDGAGYGLAQWTYWTRKKALLDFAKDLCASVGNLDVQLNFLMKEIIESYKPLLVKLKTAETVKEASDAVLLMYEQPSDKGDAVKSLRASYGQKYFDTYTDVHAETTPTGPADVAEVRASEGADNLDKTYSGEYKVLTDLYMRDGPGTKYKALTVLPKDTTVRCYGYYSVVNGTVWMYVQTTIGITKYTGFCSKKYLKKS